MTTVTLSKDGAAFSKECVIPAEVIMENVEQFPGVSTITLYYFKRLNLLPAAVFRHIGGTGLNFWLEGCSIHWTGSNVAVEDLRYVHGRSEAMKGTPVISAVLLAKPTFTKDVPMPVWMTYLPEVYRRFSLLK